MVVLQLLGEQYIYAIHDDNQQEKSGMAPWSPFYERAFWEAHSKEEHIKRVQGKYKIFDCETWNETVEVSIEDVVLDIGGGIYGGALREYSGKGKKVLVDLIADSAVAQGEYPDIVPLCCDFRRIPLSSRSCAIVFAWEVFDHAQTLGHMKQGIRESARVLKMGGVLYFEQPLREQPQEGHLICIDREMIIELYRQAGLELLKDKSSKFYYRGIFRKVERGDVL